MRPFENIRAVIFDLDGTLRHSRPAFSDTLFEIAADLGVDLQPDTRRVGMRWLHYYWAQSPELMDDMEAFPDSQADFWTRHAQRVLFAMGCSSAESAGLAPQIYHRMETFKPDDWVEQNVPPALQSLKDSGYRLAVLSNRTRPYTEQLTAIGLSSYFEFAVAAGEINTWKPDPGVFHYAIDLLKIPIHQALYVGDNYYADVVGARGAGLQALLLDPDGTFPDADCPVIRSLADLPGLLAGQ